MPGVHNPGAADGIEISVRIQRWSTAAD